VYHELNKAHCTMPPPTRVEAFLLASAMPGKTYSGPSISVAVVLPQNLSSPPEP